MAKTKVTRIKASDSSPKVEEESAPVTRKKVEVRDKKDQKNAEKAEKAKLKADKKAEKAAKNAGKKPFILIRPFVYFGRYFKDSWHELRQVRWPSRKATWKMVLAVFIYTAILMVFILLLDMFFTWVFNLILS